MSCCPRPGWAGTRATAPRRTPDQPEVDVGTQPADELEDLVSQGWQVIDVRTDQEHAAGAIQGSQSIPVDTLREHLGTLGAGPFVVYCEVGQRGHTATALLQDEFVEMKGDPRAAASEVLGDLRLSGSSVAFLATWTVGTAPGQRRCELGARRAWLLSQFREQSLDFFERVAGRLSIVRVLEAVHQTA